MRRAAVLACLAALAGPVAADAPAPVYDRVDLSVSATDEVENDVTVAVLFSQHEGPNAAAVSDEVNRAVTWAVERAHAVKDVEVRTLGYQTTPVYRDQAVTGWRVRQSLELRGRDAGALTTLVGELQSRLGVASIGHDVSRARRHAAQDRLIGRALTAFRDRAGLVTRELGRARYRIVHLDVATSGDGPRPMPRVAMAMGQARVAPPTVEAGTQEVTVRISGTIELEGTP